MAKRPHILILGPLPPPIGGMAMVMENLTNSRLSKYYEAVFINNGKKTPINRTIFEGIFSQFNLILKILDTVNKRNIELVHIHTCSGFTFWRDSAHMMILKLLRRKVILHIHGGFFDKFISKLSPIGKYSLKRVIKLSTALIVLSPEWKEKLCFIAPSANWKVIPNGVKLQEEKKIRKKHITNFLFTGHLCEEKGVYDLLAAFNQAFKIGLKGRLRIAGGEGNSYDLKNIKGYIEKLECKEFVNLMGIIAGEEKIQTFKETDCLVLPSHAEGLPMAILEAMAYSIPVIATKVGAIPELIKDGEEGFLVDPKDIKSLSECLGRFAKRPYMREKMGRSAREKIQENYSLEIMVNRLICLYNEILS